MNSDVEKFIKGESRNAFKYFGAHKVSDGACFRVYAPHAIKVEVVMNEVSHPMERIDFRGIFEARVSNIKEFDSYHYEILNNRNEWVNKMDPYTFYNEDGRGMYVESDEYIFNDEKWADRDRTYEYFNACILSEDFKIDEQRAFFDYVKKNNFNYVIIRPYDEKFLYSVNYQFVNDASLKNFIDNLHQINVGVIFDFDTRSFLDYEAGLNDFDGDSVYNLTNDKYDGVDRVYFDYSKNHTKSYVASFIHYYMSSFHGDGMYLNDSEFNKAIASEYDDKIVIYKGNENIDGYASDRYLMQIIDNINSGFDHKKFLSITHDSHTYILYDYNKIVSSIKGGEGYKQEVARMMLALAYMNEAYVITTYYKDTPYEKSLNILTGVYTNSKALYGKNKKNLLLDGKKHKYYAKEYISKNDYILLFMNFGQEEEEYFDLGMNYYGYYKLMLDSKENNGRDQLYVTREKKAHNKNMAMKIHLNSNMVAVYKRMKDI